MTETGPAPTGTAAGRGPRSRAGALWAYLTLVRPPNLPTAFADVLAGAAASGAVAAAATGRLPWLLLATGGLYAGGVVLNDVFDAALDARERPERPIPSGRASRRGAAAFGALLLAGGVLAALAAGTVSAAIAGTVALLVLSYDGAAKHHALAGPLNMGLCRGGNLLLGVSAVPAMVAELWFLALLPIAYVAAITAVSRGEVHGGGRAIGWAAVALVGAVVAGLLLLGLRADYGALWALPFAALLAARVLPAFVRAAARPKPDRIRAAVTAGVLSLIVLDAALAAGFAGPLYGLAVLALLPLSMGLARLFAVT